MMGQAGTFPGEKVKRQADIFSGERGITVRQSAADQPEKNERHIALVLMASGYGRRYGSNKLLEEFRGKPLFVHALEQAAGSGADSICVVTRYLEIRDYVDRWKKAGRRGFHGWGNAFGRPAIFPSGTDICKFSCHPKYLCRLEFPSGKRNFRISPSGAFGPSGGGRLLFHGL